MTDFAILEDDESDYVYPSYKDKGDLIVEIIKPGPYSDGRKSVYEWQAEEYEYDSDTCVSLLHEEIGFDYWLSEIAEDSLEEGFWVFEDIQGTYYRGDGWTTDDDVEWEYRLVRKATIEEIAMLFDCSF